MFHESSVVAACPSVASPKRRHPGRQDDNRGPTGRLLAVLWRRRAWIAAGALLGLITALAFLALAAPRHTAVAQLLFDPNGLRVIDNTVTTSSPPSDANTVQVESQVRVLTSDKVVRRVIAELNLDQDPEFVGATQGTLAALDRIARRLDLASSVSGKDPAVIALQNLSPALVARRQERTYVVDLSVTTQAPDKSARIANAIIQVYLADLDAARTDAVQRTTDALSSRLQELKDRVRDAEDRSEKYKAEHNIIATSGQLVNEQQLTDLSSQLTQASARAEEAKARLDQIGQLKRADADPGAISEAVQSRTMTALRAQYAEVLRREAELATQLGARHPSMIDIKEQARDLRQVIDREVAHFAEAARGDHDRARATQEALERRLAALKREAVSTSQALVRLRELERDVEASRAVYQAFLVRSRETSEQERFSTANVRILSEASQPARKTWPPRAMFVLATALALGAVAGAGLGVIRDRSDDRIRSRRDLEAVSRLPILAEIPGLPEEDTQKDWRTRMLAKARAHRQGVALMAALLDAPTSGFTVGIQRLVSVLRSTGPKSAPRVTTVVAAGAPGARSDVALNLALATASNPKRVLLVDADLRRRELSSRVLGGNGDGLLDVADHRVELDGALIAEPQTGLMVLQAGHPADGDGRSIDPDRVIELLERACDSYSIVVDGPSDRFDPLSRALAATADSIILVVTAEQTRARDVAKFQRSADLSARKLRGIVFVSGPNSVT